MLSNLHHSFTFTVSLSHHLSFAYPIFLSLFLPLLSLFLLSRCIHRERDLPRRATEGGRRVIESTLRFSRHLPEIHSRPRQRNPFRAQVQHRREPDPK